MNAYTRLLTNEMHAPRVGYVAYSTIHFCHELGMGYHDAWQRYTAYFFSDVEERGPGAWHDVR
jgi:hypothetical protein